MVLLEILCPSNLFMMAYPLSFFQSPCAFHKDLFAAHHAPVSVLGAQAPSSGASAKGAEG